MRHATLFAASAAIALSAAHLAGAQSFAAAITFDAMDFDHDGVLYVDEVVAFFALRAAAVAAGSSGGGQLNPQPNPKDLFTHWDANCDGKVTRAEFDAANTEPRDGQIPLGLQ